MVKGKDILSLKREIWLQAPPQPSTAAEVTDVEGDLFWTNLPRDGRQVLVLQEGQEVTVGVPHYQGFYSATTQVMRIGKDHNRFYGLTIPVNFDESVQRESIRANYSTNALFKAGKNVAQTAMVNFSSGGLMVYLVPALENVVQSGEKIILYLDIDHVLFQAEVRLAWRKNYDNIPFAGFVFAQMPPNLQEALTSMAAKYKSL